MRRSLLMLALAAAGIADRLPAQAPARDTLRLGALHAAALRTDPRLEQFQLRRAQTELRLRDIRVERLPAFTAEGVAQYQSDVTKLPVQLPLPGGATLPSPANDTYDARLQVQQRLYDPSSRPRTAVERAQLAQSEAQLSTSLYGLRQEVNEAFFAAALLEARSAELSTAIADLEAQLRTVSSRVRAGTALRGDAATLEAELLRRRESHAELRANRRAALDVLAQLAGLAVDEGDTLVLPALDGTLPPPSDTTTRRRPEYAQFSASRELLVRQEQALAAHTKPRLSLFGRVGYGRPGLNMLSDEFDSYWLGGVQVQWSPFNWGTTRRGGEVLALQRRIVNTEEAAFTSGLRRMVANDLANIERLQSTLATDERIIDLLETAAREARARLREGVITAAEYVDRQTDVLNARLTRATHRVELARSRARYLTILGHEVH